MPRAITPPAFTTSDTLSHHHHLGKLIRQHTHLLRSLGWYQFIRKLQHPSDCAAHLRALPHSAGPYLHRLASRGVPAPSTSSPWSTRQKRQHLRRGAHPSAHVFKEFLHQDMLDMVQKGYWSILPFSEVEQFVHLKLSPAGVVPQRTRRPRPIMDYTFTDINSSSVPLSPLSSMQFGQTLQRLLQRIAYADPSHGPPLLMKLDLSDGYYRIHLSPEAALELAVTLPGLRPGAPLVGIPLCLPMGWCHSPPFFCAFTETAADLANITINNTTPHTVTLQHPLALTSQQHSVPREFNYHPDARLPPGPPPSQNPLAYVDIYMDDFIGLAQRPRLTHTLNVLLNSIDLVFRGVPHPDDKPDRKQVISASKLAAGEGAWSTTKSILGWIVDTARGTIHLPAHKSSRLRELICDFTHKKRTSRKQWYRLLGELRHFSYAIRGASYLFSILQSLLTDNPNASRLRLHAHVQAALRDWYHLTTSMADNPVNITSLVPCAPSTIGCVDASGDGIGGFWLPTCHGNASPTVFRLAFPPHIKAQLVSATNPAGKLTNSDFELAALVAGTAMLIQHSPAPIGSVWFGSDNVAAVSWCQRGSTSSTGPNAHLLRWLAKLTQDHEISLQAHSIPGSSNTLADFCSRSFHLQESDFLQALNTHFHIEPSWTLVQPTPDILWKLTSTLSTTMLPWESLANAPQLQTPHGTRGNPSAPPFTLTPPSKAPPIPSCPSKSSPIVTVGETFLPAKLKYVAKQWETPFAPLDRRWPTWDTPTPG